MQAGSIPPSICSFLALRNSRIGLLSVLFAIGLAPAWQLQAESLNMPINGNQFRWQYGNQPVCATQIAGILNSAETWALDTGDQMPPSLEVLTNELGSPSFLYCPANYRESTPSNWADVDWSKIDYQWDATANWQDPLAVVCTCLVHENLGRVEGSVRTGWFRNGWPLITAGPRTVFATPGETARFEFRVATNALMPVSYQWRREELGYATNVEQYINPDDPRGTYWRTNVVSSFVGTNLTDQTRSTLVLTDVKPADTAYYRITVSNSLGVSSCAAQLHVASGNAGCSTKQEWANLYCSNNLVMAALLSDGWARVHDNQYPPSLSAMTNTDGSSMFGWPEALYCRADTLRSPPADWSGVDFADTSYEMNQVQPSQTEPWFRCRAHGYYIDGSLEVMFGPRFKSATPVRLADGSTEISYRLFAGRTNVLEASSDLANWAPLKTHSTEAGSVSFIDKEAATHRFYRVRLE